MRQAPRAAENCWFITASPSLGNKAEIQSVELRPEEAPQQISVGASVQNEERGVSNILMCL